MTDDKFSYIMLTSGEAIFGKLVENKTSFMDANITGGVEDVTIMQPLLLGRGPQGPVLINYLETVAENQCTFYAKDIRHDNLTPVQPLIDTWNEKFGAGISIVKTMPGH